ncbi:hypothetical protein CSOJ01_05794 [Colletotrichum sojae]|uniref:Uncharacterized protein n=1 Tax=Colletotrichum sojae TaxID=2175907 RepID=A0A8H6JF25_9PEZI|nr:hypothetical protein CSOJ01_05794 [Colletotrichum sojae]
MISDSAHPLGAAGKLAAGEALKVATLADATGRLDSAVAAAAVSVPAEAGLPAVLGSGEGGDGAEDDSSGELHVGPNVETFLGLRRGGVVGFCDPRPRKPAVIVLDRYFTRSTTGHAIGRVLVAVTVVLFQLDVASSSPACPLIAEK